MNTLQLQSILPAKSASNIVDLPSGKLEKRSTEAQELANQADTYRASAANDAVVAKVLSFSINKSVEHSIANEKSQTTNSLNEKFKFALQDEPYEFDIESVTNNVVGFVGKALSNLAMQGHDSDKLEYFKNQAIAGVEVGVDQAKIELVGIVDDDIFDIIDDTRDLIIGGIKSLPHNKEDYLINVQNANSLNTGTDKTFNTVDIIGPDNQAVKIDFEKNAFSESSNAQQGKNVYTTSASNISFSLESNMASNDATLLADLVNKFDSLANSFYRGNVESSYNKSIELGYSDGELVGLAHELRKAESAQTTKAYGEIQHLDKAQDMKELTAPKAVADYLNRYLDVLESNNATLPDERDFKQIINGLVNQMKDVQVPDLLQAINRFHTFNSKFNLQQLR